MQVLEFRFMSKDDYSETKREAWSRVYEYPFVLERLKKLNLDTPLIHNTGCGWAWVHKDFAMELEKYWSVINSDNQSRDLEFKQSNFINYDLLKQCSFKADVTLCVSTLEHLDNQIWALRNLWEATEEWWYLICTFDCPPVNLHIVEDFVLWYCADTPNRLTPKNSIIPHPERDWINVVALVIKK